MDGIEFGPQKEGGELPENVGERCHAKVLHAVCRRISQPELTPFWGKYSTTLLPEGRRGSVPIHQP